MKTSIKVKLDNGDIVELKKLPIKKYSELFLALQELPKVFGDIEGSDSKAMLANLPLILSTATPEVIKIVAIASEKDESYIENLGLDEVTDIIAAALEVNNYDKIVSNIKKLTANRKPKTLPANQA